MEVVREDRWAQERPTLTTLGRRSRRMKRGRGELRVELDPSLGRLPRGRAVRAVLTVEAVGASGRRRVATRDVLVVPR